MKEGEDGRGSVGDEGEGDGRSLSARVRGDEADEEISVMSLPELKTSASEAVEHSSGLSCRSEKCKSTRHWHAG